MKALLTTFSFILMMPFLAHAATIHISPSQIFQGDPTMITVSSTTISNIRSGSIAGSKLYFFTYNNTPTALYGVDINQKVGTTSVTIVFTDGSIATASFFVQQRPRPQEFLAIPAQIGGNSVANQAKILFVLGTENADLASIHSRMDKTLWTASGTNPFLLPVASSTAMPLLVTDPYGYSRDSGADTITHKGVDFRAPPGTPVYAINRGVVRTAKPYVIYGNSVIIDHGLGLLSMYMHLSTSTVSAGQLVSKGQLIGYSGETGYSEGPHLHLTIRIGGVSIDPIKFFALFGAR